MILDFTFKNYKSFRDENTLSLKAGNVREYDEQVTRSSNFRILPAAAIFGANASGKSNVLDALRFMVTYIDRSFSYANSNSKKRKHLLPRPFTLDRESRHQPSVFSMLFTLESDPKERIYEYGFSIDKQGVVEEWLLYSPKSSKNTYSIFERDGMDLTLDEIDPKYQENIRTSLARETLVLSLGKLLGEPLLLKISSWFEDITFYNFGDPIENAWVSRVLPDDFLENTKVQEDVVEYLRSFDPSIIGFNIEENTSDDPEEESSYRVEALHNPIDGTGKPIPIPMIEESAGTQKMFALYHDFQAAIQNGGVLVIDELNSRLHPLLTKDILISFLDPEINLHHAQIIFTSHDAWLLDCGLLRRDEIWFTEKENQVSELYSFCAFKDSNGHLIRKDENFQRNYLKGKYGSIPILENFFRVGF